MQTKPDLDYGTATVIKVAGMDRFVPVLAMRQNRIIVPLLLKVLPIVERAGVFGSQVAQAQEGDPLLLQASEAVLSAFGGDTLNDLNTIVFTALSRAYDISFDEYLDLEITANELFEAVPNILKQTGLFKKRPGGAPVGEGLAAS